MTKFNVAAPEPAYSGAVGAVQFTGGKAVIDEDTNPGELAYCRAQGYGVEPAEEAEPEPEAPKRARKVPAKAATETKTDDPGAGGSDDDNKEGAGQ